MNWILMAWPAIAAAAATMALVQLGIWFRNRRAAAHLVFAFAAVALAGFSVLELLLMFAGEVPRFLLLHHWTHVMGFVLFVTLGWFVRLYLAAGRLWLLLFMLAVRLVVLVLEWVLPFGVNFSGLTELKAVTVGSAVVFMPVGTSGWLSRVAEASVLLLLVFVVDAAVSAWRRGSRQRAVLVSVGFTLFLVCAVGQMLLMRLGLIEMPYMVSLAFLGLIIPLGYDLGADVARAARLSDRLRASEEKFRMAVNASPNALVMADPQGRITLVNPQAERLFGYSSSEMMGQPVELLVPETGRKMHAAYRAVYAAAPEVRPMGADRQLFARRKDGSLVQVEIGLSPFRTEEGLFVLSVVVDISARVESERTAAELRRELAQITRVSTMGELAASLAHELNQPLAAIVANADAAELHVQNPQPDLKEVGSILEDIRKDGLRAGDTIHRMRAFLQRREIAMQPLDVDRLVRECGKFIATEAVARRIGLRLEIEPGLPPVRGDEVQLQQVLLNLMLNGLDAMNGGVADGRCLVVSARRVDAGTVELAVRDLGHGLPSDKLARVFEPFFTTKRTGLGLGLAICRTIVEAHGGRITLENNPEGGATARFTLSATVGQDRRTT